MLILRIWQAIGKEWQNVGRNLDVDFGQRQKKKTEKSRTTPLHVCVFTISLTVGMFKEKIFFWAKTLSWWLKRNSQAIGNKDKM